MPDITVTITQEQYNALSVMTEPPKEHIQRVTEYLADRMTNELVDKLSDKKVNRMTKAEKKVIMDSIDLVKEKDERKGKKDK